MTPERKKYLASISKEERIIRNAIGLYRTNIFFRKRYLNSGRDKDKPVRLSQEKRGIGETKTIIKNLKKRLPAPKKEVDIGLYWAILNCPICRTTTPIHAGYCLCCGQKLR